MLEEEAGEDLEHVAGRPRRPSGTDCLTALLQLPGGEERRDSRRIDEGGKTSGMPFRARATIDIAVRDDGNVGDSIAVSSGRSSLQRCD